MMPQHIVEGDIELYFEDDWVVCKLDERDFYVNQLRKVHGSCAVDFVCCRPGRVLSLVELKDFRDHRVDNRGQFGPDYWEEMAQKVRDSVTLIAAAQRRQLSGVWEDFGNTLFAKDTRLNALLWAETSRNRRTKSKRSTAQSRLQGLLSWLSPTFTGVVATDRLLADEFGLANYELRN